MLSRQLVGSPVRLLAYLRMCVIVRIVPFMPCSSGILDEIAVGAERVVLIMFLVRKVCDVISKSVDIVNRRFL